MSSSKNTAMVADVDGTTDLFEVRMDGVVAAESACQASLTGDVLETARRLAVEAARAARGRGRALRRRGRPPQQLVS